MNTLLTPLRGALAPARQLGTGRVLRALLPALRFGKPAQITRHTLLGLWQQYGDREAIIAGDERVSFAQFADRAIRLANVLHSQGLGAGDSMALLSGNNALWFEAMAATTLLGMKMPLINWHLNPTETAACIRLSGASALLVSDAFIASIDQTLRSELSLVLVAGQSGHGYPLLDDALATAATTLPDGQIGFSPKLFSGGTTGTPKFIELDRSKLRQRQSSGLAPGRTTLLRLALQLLSVPALLKLDQIRDPHSHNLRSLVCSPLYHAGGQASAFPIFLGGTIVTMEKFSPQAFLRLIEKERINWTFVAPTMLERVLALPNEELRRYDLSSMRVILCSAAPCPARVKSDINALFRRQGNRDDVFYEFYGSSESGPVTVLLPEDYADNPERYHSVGKARIGDCRILDTTTGHWAPAGQTGKILLRSPAVYALAYGGKSEAEMRKHFVDVDGELWYDDGLAGYLDDDGYLFITGRDKEMLIAGGVNIYPNEIEFALKQHPGILDAAVVGIPAGDLGEVPAAVVSWHSNAPREDEAGLIEFCKSQGLYGFKLPRRIIITDDLPRDGAGKLRKNEIRNSYGLTMKEPSTDGEDARIHHRGERGEQA
ncbi:MAG: class I adenylate-forming enzyme family protein [Alcanivoracaceae bacterium]